MERDISRWELTPVQRQVYEALKDKEVNGHHLGDWYLGAIYVLQDKHNPERISHAAQSMRELLEKLLRVIDEGAVPKKYDFQGMRRGIIKRWEKDREHYGGEWKGKKINSRFDKTLRRINRYVELNQKPTRKEQIQSTYEKSDPMAYVLGQYIQEEKRKKFFEVWEQFEDLAHHQSPLDEDILAECLAAAEQVILELLAPITAPNQQIIKAILSKSDPTESAMNGVLDLVRVSGANYTFFFKKVQDPVWIQALEKRGLFEDPPAGEPDSEGQLWFRLWQPLLFLQRVANTAPDQVVEVLANLPETVNPRTSHRICVIASEMDDIKSSLKLRPWVDKYIRSFNDLLDAKLVIDLLRRWGEGSEDSRAAALDLLAPVVRFQSDPESTAKRNLRAELVEKEELGWESSLTTELKPAPRFKDYDYLRILEDGVLPLAEKEPVKVAHALVAATEQMIRFSSHKRDEDGISWTRLDGPVRGFPDSREALIHALNLACEMVYERAPDSIEALDQTLRNQERKLFERLRHHLYFKYPSDQTLPWIREMILNYKDYTGVGYDYEFQQMLRKACEYFGPKLLNENEAAKIFEEILDGPPTETYQLVTGFTGTQFTEEEAESWQRFHHLKKLRPFVTILFGRHQTYFQELEREFTETALSDEEYLPFRTGRGGLVSYVSPQSSEVIAMKEDEELLSFINEWEDEHEDREDWLKRVTIRGLADEFQKLFGSVICHQEERLKFWIQNRDLIERPVYVTAIVQAFQDHVREHHFQWLDNSFEFCQWVLTHPDEESNDGEQRHEDSREHPDWSSSRRAVMDFVETCLKKEVNVPLTARTSLASLFALLCNQSDWRLDHDEPFFRDKSHLIREAINNTRSRALFHLTDFAKWVQTHNPEDRLHDLTSILETRFGNDAESPLTMPERAILGLQYGNLFTLNQEWAIEHKADFFPQKDFPNWGVAFGSFLVAHLACIPFFEALKEDYSLAIDHLEELDGVRFFGEEATEKLGQHLLDYHCLWNLYPLYGDGSLLERYYSKTTGDRKQWANLFDHFGRSLSKSKNTLEGALRDRVVAFFDWRFQKGEPEELRLFGFWLKAECLDPEWRLDALMKLLDLNQWKERKLFLMLDSLERMLESHPAKVVECFALMTETFNHGDLYLKSTVKTLIVAGLNSEDYNVNEDAERARENLLRGGEFDLSDFEESL